MLARILILLLAAAPLTAQQGKIPLAIFSGTVHGVSNKSIIIETPEENLLEFEINRKTKVLRDKKEIRPSDLSTGDTVTIEAKQEMVRFLVAITITAQPKT
jgi:hypothetical protein